MVTKELLHELFEYFDGELYWKKSLNSRAIKGSVAGSKIIERYKYIGINGNKYLLHRIIFFYHYGYFPIEVDHIDCNPSNNRIENLRAATHFENRYNQKMNIRNTTGVKGLIFDKYRNQWIVRFNINGKAKFFGRFKEFELADLVAQEARSKYHGNFANHG